MTNLTQRQQEVLAYVKQCGPVRSGGDGTQLRALERKGLVVRHAFAQGQNIYYTWTAATK